MMNFENNYQKAYYILFGIALVLFPIISFQFGISGDEFVHSEQSKRVIEFFTSGFQNTESATTGVLNKTGDMSNIFYYGQSLDVMAYLVSKVLFFMDIYDVRHLVSILFSLFGIFITTQLIRRIAGWQAALLGLIIFLVSLRYLGHSFNNLKDAPFAVAYALGLYGIIRFLGELPNPSKKTLFIAIAGLAVPLSIRVGGLLLFAYLGLFVGLQYILFTSQNKKPNLLAYSKNTIIVMVAGYFLGLILWPYGLLNPLTGPLTALSKFSGFSVAIGQLFEGSNIPSTQLPSHYLVKYIAITAPLVALAGLALSPISAYLNKKNYNLFYIGVVAFALVFPLGYIYYKKANVYGGWRHVLFVYPTIVVLAAIGWDGISRLIKSEGMKKGVLVSVVLLSIIPLQWGVRNFPHWVTYFNPTIGGMQGAYGNYETDYYYNSTKTAYKWLINNTDILEQSKTRQVKVASNIWYAFRPYFEKHDSIKPVYTRYYDRNKKDWDYGIFTTSYVKQSQLQNGSWPPAEKIHAVTAGGAPLVGISKRPSKEDIKGFEALEASDWNNAIGHFEEYLKSDQTSETVHESLGIAYLRAGNYPRAAKALTRANDLLPGSVNTLYNLGVAYAQSGQTDYAITALQQALQQPMNPQFAKQIYGILAQLYQSKGDTQNAQRYKQAAQ